MNCVALSNSEIDQLGDRLRNNCLEDGDLKKLHEFRQTYSDIDVQVYKLIEDTLKTSMDKLKLVITKRKRKTRQSIVDKLYRQKKLRLSQMQDIVGCRIVVRGGAQAACQVNTQLANAFEEKQLRIQSKPRNKDSYRAIHLIVKINKKSYEIQLRTLAQDVFANLVERLSDKDNTLKYGGSDKEQPVLKKLKALSDTLVDIDKDAHTVSFNHYHQQIKEVTNDVLSD